MENNQNIQTNNHRDIANLVETYRIILKGRFFEEIHQHVLNIIIQEAGRKKRFTLGVLGPGPTFSPYTYHQQVMDELWTNTFIVALDYNQEVLDKAVQTIEELLPYWQEVKRITMGPGEIALEKQDFNQGLGLEERIGEKYFDCIEATLTLHHIANYEKKTVNFLRQVYEALKPGGVFILGEGFADMRYSETRIKNFLQQYGGTIVDKRNETTEYYHLEDGQTQLGEESLIEGGLIQGRNPENKNEIIITRGGKVIIGEEIFPLIDPKKDLQSKGHQKGVDYFYKQTKKDFKPLLKKRESKGVAKKVLDGVKQEQEYARRGLVEFYSPEEFWFDCLRGAGFEKIERIKGVNEHLPYGAEMGVIKATKTDYGIREEL